MQSRLLAISIAGREKTLLITTIFVFFERNNNLTHRFDTDQALIVFDLHTPSNPIFLGDNINTQIIVFGELYIALLLHRPSYDTKHSKGRVVKDSFNYYQ